MKNYITKKKRTTTVKAKKSKKISKKNVNEPVLELRLYIAGNTTKSLAALENLKVICLLHLKGKYKIEVIDLLLNPQLAKGDEIFAIPTLVRKLPVPIKKIIGDLSDMEKVMVGLNIRELT